MALYKNKFLFFSVLVFILSLVFFYGTMPWTKNLVLKENNQNRNIQLPLYEKGRNDRVYEVKGEIYRGLAWQKTININVGECLLEIFINKKEIFGGTDCLKKPIGLNLDGLLDYGRNNIEIKFRGDERTSALYFSGSLNDPLFLVINILLMISLSFLIFIVMRRLGLNKILSFIFVGGLLLRLFYVSHTDYFQRDHDNFTSTGHLGYIQYVANNLALPDANQGWEFHQAPAYYIMAALIYKSSNFLNLYNAIKIQQLFNIFLFMVFLFYGFLILKLFIKDKKEIILPTLLLVFWPSGIMHSARISNDAMFYAFFAIGLYFLTRWYNKDRNFKSLFLSVLFGSLTLATKSNGLIFIGILLPVVSYVFWKNCKEEKNIKYWFSLFWLKGLILFLVLSLGFGVGWYGKIKTVINGSKQDWLSVNQNRINPLLRVENHFKNYVFFDGRLFFTEPFVRPWDDMGGRQFLPVYLLKSSILGEWSFENNNIKTVALILNFLFFIPCLYFLIGIFTINKKVFETNLVIFLNIVIGLAGVVFYRIGAPFACNQDFRYILPILISFVYFVSLGLKTVKKKGWIVLKYFGCLNILFVILSIVLIVIIR